MTKSPEQLNRSPIRYLSIAWLITLATLGAFLWCAFDSYRRFADTAEKNLRIQELRGQIIYLDEVLTMSARMYALTADAGWEARYRQFEPQLEAAIREVLSHSLGAQTTKETDEANAVLVALEGRSMELARQGKLDEAKATLFSEQYSAQKAIYREGMDKLGKQLVDAASSAMQSERRRIYFQIGAGAVIIGLLVVGWLVIVRLTSHGMRMRKQLDKIEHDLDVARDIQRGLLPRDAPDTPGFDIEGWSKPADQTGGDYFDWMKLPDGSTLITLADVTGHGIGPALIVAVCRAYMRAAAAGNGAALELAIARVNDLLQLDIPAERFVTAAVGVLRPGVNEMSLVSAGQAPIFFYRAATQTVENWAADDLPLGVMSGVTFDSPRLIRFEPGDALVLITDGFFEWSNGKGEQFGIKRLEEFVAAHAQEPPSAFISALHAKVLTHAAGQVQPDDLTIVIVKRNGQPQRVTNSGGEPISTSQEAPRAGGDPDPLGFS